MTKPVGMRNLPRYIFMSLSCELLFNSRTFLAKMISISCHVTSPNKKMRISHCSAMSTNWAMKLRCWMKPFRRFEMILVSWSNFLDFGFQKWFYQHQVLHRRSGANFGIIYFIICLKIHKKTTWWVHLWLQLHLQKNKAIQLNPSRGRTIARAIHNVIIEIFQMRWELCLWNT